MCNNEVRVPERMCIVCRTLKARTHLLRLVRPTSKTEIVPPLAHECGKGFYVCRDLSCIKRLQTDKRIRKIYASKISADTQAWLEQQLEETGPSGMLS